MRQLLFKLFHLVYSIAFANLFKSTEETILKIKKLKEIGNEINGFRKKILILF